jgi:hypothetical protein
MQIPHTDSTKSQLLPHHGIHPPVLLQPHLSNHLTTYLPPMPMTVSMPMQMPNPKMNPMRKKRMPQRLGRREPLVRVERQTPFQQVHKVVELSTLGVAHARRRGQEARAQVPRRLDARQGSHVCLTKRKGNISFSLFSWFVEGGCVRGRERGGK